MESEDPVVWDDAFVAGVCISISHGQLIPDFFSESEGLGLESSWDGPSHKVIASFHSPMLFVQLLNVLVALLHVGLDISHSAIVHPSVLDDRTVKVFRDIDV